MGITVNELLIFPFFYRSLQNKIRIISDGKPRPSLQISAVPVNNGMVKIKIFHSEIYNEIPWLTGCEIQQKLYCWLCLLFNTTEDKQWKVTELISNLPEFKTRHENTAAHTQATLEFKAFTSEHLKGINIELEHDRFYGMVRTNRLIMKLLIDAVCIVVTSDHMSRDQTIFKKPISPAICVKALNVIKFSNNLLQTYCDDAIKLIGKSTTLLDDLIRSITKAVKIYITKELKTAAYVSLILSEHSTNITKSKLSVIFRFIKNDEVCERFLGFVIISGPRKADVIYDVIMRVIEVFEIQTKLFSYSFDGALLELRELIDLNRLLQKKYPQSYVVPCYFHRIQHILQQSLSFNKELAWFFNNLVAMQDYFKIASEQRRVLENFMFITIPRENAICFFKSPFIIFVHMCRKHFIEALESIAKKCTKCSEDDIIKARGFLQFLEEFCTVFLLHSLSQLFKHTMLLDIALRNSLPEIKFPSHTVFTVMRKILSEKYNFHEYFNNAVLEISMANDKGNESKLSKEKNFTYQKETFYSQHINIIHHLVNEIKLRFCKLENFVFCSLVNSNVINIPLKELTNCYWKLDEATGLNINAEQLSRELKFQIENGVFENKNAYDFLHYFKDVNQKTSFPYTQKLIEFTLTLPLVPPMQDGDSSKFQKISRLAHLTTEMEPLDACVLHVESAFLCSLQTDEFYYEVFRKFCEMNKNFELEYSRKNI